MLTDSELSRLANRDLWTYYLAMFDLALAAEGLAESSRRKHGSVLGKLRESFPKHAPFSLDGETLTGWLGHEKITPKTWRSRRQTLQKFYAWAVHARLSEHDPALALPLSRPASLGPAGPAPERPKGPPRALLPEPWREPLEQFEQYMHLQGRPATTRATRRQHLGHLARHLDPLGPWEVSAAHLFAYMVDNPEVSQETRRNRRSAARTFYAWALMRGYVTQSPAEHLPPVAPGHALPRPITETALADALDAAPDRERLMIRLAAECGLRRAEVAAVHSEDMQEVNGRTLLLVHGKGARQRLVPLPKSLADTLAQRPTGYVFPSDTALGHLTPVTVGNAVARALPKPWTMHKLRHRFATLAYRQSRDLFAVQRLMGHTSPVVTQRYVALDVSELIAVVDAVDALALPAPSRLSA